MAEIETGNEPPASAEAVAAEAAGPDLSQKHGIVLFDGVCNFCNGSVNFIIDHDPHDYFRFAALQSDAGQELLARFNLPRSDFDTMTVIENGKVYQKSSAAFRISRHLGFPLNLGGLLLLIPPVIRDAGYSLIARNRYKWFGRQDQCRIPTPEIRSRFWAEVTFPDWSCRLQRLESAEFHCHEQMQHYGLLWLETLAQGELELDFEHHLLAGAQIVFWSPGQICRLGLSGASGWRLDFGLDTFCQSGLSDVLLEALGLFPPLAPPLLLLPAAFRHELADVWRWWEREQETLPYQRQVVGTYLRLMLLRCGRLRAQKDPALSLPADEAGLWPRFRQLLEGHFRQWHQVGDYAHELAVTPGHLNQLVKQASGRSAKQLIQERLMLEARRAAWFSPASLKQIAYDLGFDDPAYFSRLFRRCSGQSFTAFRERIREMSIT